MLFIQQFTRNEYIFGDRTIIVAVSDSYSELLNSEVFTETNILEIEETDSSLDIEKGAASKGELSFSIKQASCINEDDINALFFCLDASNDDVGRYIAIWIDNRQNSDCEFIGKISSKISGDDKFWDAGAYAAQIDPIREYKFTAFSIDLEILQQVKINEKIKTPDGVFNSLKERLSALELSSIFYHRPICKVTHELEQYPDDHYFYQRPTGNLYLALQYILNLTSQAVEDILGTLINFTIKEAFIGIQSNYVQYDSFELYWDTGRQFPTLTNIKESATKLKWKLDPDDKDPLGEWSSIFVSDRLIMPVQAGDDTAYNNMGSNLSMEQFNNVAEFISAVAESLGCYLVTNYVGPTEIEISFVSKDNIVEIGQTYLTGAKDGSLNTDVVVVSNDNKYFSFPNVFSVDGLDSIVLYKKEYKESIKFTEMNKKIAAEKENKDIGYKKLFLSTAQTIVCADISHLPNGDPRGEDFPFYLPVNVCWSHQLKSSNIRSDYDDTIYGGWKRNSDNEQFKQEYAKFNEVVHSAIYLAVDEVIDGQTLTTIKPAYIIFSKIQNENRAFVSLSDYLNEIYSRERKYFKTEYQLTIPYFSGFADNSSGNNPGWKYCKKGAKIQLDETVRRYNPILEEFEEEIAAKYYVITEIKRNYQTFTSTLKLQNISKFAFGYNDEVIVESEVDLIKLPNKEESQYANIVKTYEVEAGQTVNPGNAVAVDYSTNKIRESRANFNDGSVIGIADKYGTGGEKIPVITNGTVYSDLYNFTSRVAYVRGELTTNGCNIGSVGLEAANGSEDMFIIIGKVIDNHSFQLDIFEAQFEGGTGV